MIGDERLGKLSPHLRVVSRVAAVLTVAMVFCSAGFTQGLTENSLSHRVGPMDSVLVQRIDDGHVLFSQNPDTLLVPASILKIVTSLAAFHLLGEDFRFTTGFYTRPDGDLIIKGYGDPGLVSEEIDAAAFRVAARVSRVGDILVDDSFFAPSIAVDPVRRTISSGS